MVNTTYSVDLPVEIILRIVDYLPPLDYQTLWAATLVNRAWYVAGIAKLYAYPQLGCKNFDLFARAICPSKNARIVFSPVATLVRTLDMSALVHESTKSLTARLLSRLKHNLEEYIAPASSFGVNSLASLSKCHRLRRLDLSLVCATVPLERLLHSIQGLPELRDLGMPIVHQEHTSAILSPWPHLHRLHSRSARQVLALPDFPPSLSALSMDFSIDEHEVVLAVLGKYGRGLRQLALTYAFPTGEPTGRLDGLLDLCPALLALSLPRGCVTYELLAGGRGDHPLQILQLRACTWRSSVAESDDGMLRDAMHAGFLADLRQVWITHGTLTAETAGEVVAQLRARDDERRLGSEPGLFYLQRSTGPELAGTTLDTRDGAVQMY